jgi:hypothetical protein
MLAAACLVAAGESVVHQGIQTGVGYRENMAAAPTVTAVGAAEFFVFFMPKGDAPGPAVACGDVDIGFVNELHGIPAGKNEKPRAFRRRVLRGARCRSSRSCDAHRVLVQWAFDSKLDMAFNQRKQCVVFADADIGAGVELGATLTHDDRACADQLSAK